MKKADVKVGKRYASALFELCPLAECEAMLEALKTFSEIWSSSQSLRDSLLNPSLLLSQRLAALKSIADLIKPADTLFMNVLAVLLRNKRLDSIESVVDIFAAMFDVMRRHLSLDVVSAFDLSAAEKESVRERVRSACGIDASLNWRVDRALMGGLIIRAGDRMIDGSIRGSLEKLRADFLA